VTVQSVTEFEVDASGWPRRAVETESLAVRWAEGLTVRGTSRTQATLQRVEARPDLAARGVEGDVVRAEQARADGRSAADRQLVGGKAFPEIVAGVRSADTTARNRSQAQLAALLRVDPAAAAAAEEAIRGGALDDNAKQRVAAALGAAGTKEAQHALADVLGAADLPAARRMDAAIALAQGKQPTAEAAGALDAAIGAADPGLSSTATLASGAVVNQANAAAGNPPDYAPTRDAVQKLVDGLRGARDDQARLVYLQALGNTGDARALPALQPFLASPSPALRGAAVFSLRFFTGASVDEALAAALHDPETGVRRAAASTLSYRRDVSPLEDAIREAVEEDKEMSVRLAVLDGLKFKLREDEAIGGLFAWSAEHDAAAEVRNLARQVLAAQKG
jgi:HEAT repeat protein